MEDGEKGVREEEGKGRSHVGVEVVVDDYQDLRMRGGFVVRRRSTGSPEK